MREYVLLSVRESVLPARLKLRLGHIHPFQYLEYLLAHCVVSKHAVNESKFVLFQSPFVTSFGSNNGEVVCISLIVPLRTTINPEPNIRKTPIIEGTRECPKAR